MNHPQGPIPVPIPSGATTAGLPRAAGAGVARTVPNLPGALTRQLSARLRIDATTAMRIALLLSLIHI